MPSDWGMYVNSLRQKGSTHAAQENLRPQIKHSTEPLYRFTNWICCYTVSLHSSTFFNRHNQHTPCLHICPLSHPALKSDLSAPLYSCVWQPTPWRRCGILLVDMSWKLSACIKWWPSWSYLNMATTFHSQRTCEAVLDACLHLSELFTIPSLNKYPFKFQWCW